MRIAIPVTDGKLSAHFGHCEKFCIIDVDSENKTIVNQTIGPNRVSEINHWPLTVSLNSIASTGQK